MQIVCLKVEATPKLHWLFGNVVQFYQHRFLPQHLYIVYYKTFAHKDLEEYQK